MTRNRKRNVRRAAGETRQASGGVLFVALAVIGLLLGAYVGKVWLQRRTSDLGVQWEQKSREVAQARDEQANLNMQKESYTDGAYVLDRARQMGLEPPSPGQVRRLVAPAPEPVVAAEDAADATELALSDRR